MPFYGNTKVDKIKQRRCNILLFFIFIYMNLQENINRIKQMMTEGKDSYVERARYDQEYEEEYPMWKKIIIKILESKIDSYAEINDAQIIVLLNKENLDKNLIKYDKINERLWYDYSLQENLEGYIPYSYLSRHFKYGLQDFFKKHFPDYGVRELTAANLISY